MVQMNARSAALGNPIGSIDIPTNLAVVVESLRVDLAPVDAKSQVSD